MKLEYCSSCGVYTSCIDFKCAVCRDIQKPNEDHRKTVIVIQVEVGNMFFLKFTTGKLAGKPEAPKYFEAYCTETAFESFERILTAEGIAHNVSHVEKLSETETSIDFKVTYNEA